MFFQLTPVISTYVLWPIPQGRDGHSNIAQNGKVSKEEEAGRAALNPRKPHKGDFRVKGEDVVV